MLVIDVETTGLDPRRHSIVSIGSIALKEHSNYFEAVDKIYGECKVRDGAEVAQEALNINGFTLEQVYDDSKVSLEELMKIFVNDYIGRLKIEDMTVAGQNPRFDTDFINESLKRYKIDFRFSYRTDDLHTIARNHYRMRGVTPPLKNGRTDLNADKIFNYVGLPAEPRPHNAFTGTKMTAEAISRLTYGKSLFEYYKDHKVPKYLKKGLASLF